MRSFITSALGDPMHSYEESVRVNPLRDNCDQTQSFHIEHRMQGNSEQSSNNEDQEKTSLIKLLTQQNLESQSNHQRMT